MTDRWVTSSKHVVSSDLGSLHCGPFLTAYTLHTSPHTAHTAARPMTLKKNPLRIVVTSVKAFPATRHTIFSFPPWRERSRFFSR